MKTIITKKDGRKREPLSLSHLSFLFHLFLQPPSLDWSVSLTELIQDTLHLCMRFTTDGIKVVSHAFSGGKQVIKFANARNSGRVCLFSNRKWRTFYLEDNKFFNLIFKCLLLVKCLNGTRPTYIGSLFKIINIGLHTLYGLRGKGLNLELPNFHLTFKKNSFTYSLTKLWNSLPPQLRLSSDAIDFKHKLHDYSFLERVL